MLLELFTCRRWMRDKSKGEKSKSKKKKISRNIKKRSRRSKCAASHDASSPLGANGYKNHPENSEETERSTSSLQNDVHMQSCLLENDMCSLVRFLPLFSATNNHSLHQHCKSPLFCWWIHKWHELPPKVSLIMQTYRPVVDPNHVFHFRAAVFFTMFPPRVKTMPSTITYLHFFVVNRDNELVAPNKTWAIESSADRPAIISAPEVNDGNGNKRRERAGLVFC